MRVGYVKRRINFEQPYTITLKIHVHVNTSTGKTPQIIIIFCSNFP